MKAKVITDSGSGLSQKEADAAGIGFLPLQVMVDDKQYLDGVDLDIPTLYDILAQGKMPTTSQPPLLLEEELFENLQKEGITDLIAVNLSGGLSSTNQIVQATAKRLGLNVHTIDIGTTLFVQRYLTLLAQALLEEGKTPDEILAELQKEVDASKGYLIVEDLDHLAAGGRLTPMAAKLGGLLKIKPILKVSKDTGGKVDIFDKVRTFNKALKKAVDQIAAELDPDTEYDFLLLNGNNDEGTAHAKELLKQAFGEDIHIYEEPMYSVIACHTGLGSVGIQYVPRREEVKLS